MYVSAIIEFKEIEVGSISKLAMVNQDIFGLNQVLLSQYVDLVEELGYKNLVRHLPKMILPWRDK